MVLDPGLSPVCAQIYFKGKYLEQKQVNLGFISCVFQDHVIGLVFEFFSSDVIFDEFNFCHSCGLKTI